MFFFYLHDSGFQRASELHGGKTLWMLAASFTDEMWILQHPNRWDRRLLLQKKKQFSKSFDKTTRTTGSSAAMFLFDMYPDPPAGVLPYMGRGIGYSF